MDRRIARGIRCALMLSLAAIAGCASLPPVPDQGGPKWARLESEHFVLLSDLEPAEARDTIRMFERLLAAYYALGWEAQGKLPVKLHAVVFDDPSEFEIFGGDWAGYHVRLVPFEPVVVMPNEREVDQFRTLKHELTHYIAFQSLPFQPLWFAEGLASYFQTASFDEEERFVIGAPARELVAVLQRQGRLRAAELLADDATDPDPRFYATAWLLVHYLMSHRGDAFVKYQDGLAEGLTSDASWRAAFPDLDTERVDEVLARYFGEGQYAYFVRSIPAYRGAEPRATVLASADVYALRAQLFSSCPNCDDDAPRWADENLRRALQLAPHHLRASVMRINSLPKKERLSLAKTLAREHPDDALAWVVRGAAELTSTPPAQCAPETLARLRELGSNSAYALMLAAVCQAQNDELPSALELSARALRRQPADVALLLMQSDVLRRAGDCAALRRLVLRIRNLGHTKLDSGTFAKLERCEAAPPPL